MLALARRLVIVVMTVRDFPYGAHGRHGLRTASSRVEPRVRRVEDRSRSSKAHRRRTPPTRADGGDVDHHVKVGAARDEGHEDFAAAAIGAGAPAPSRTRVGPRGQDCGGTHGGEASVRRRCAAPRQTRRRSRGGEGCERTRRRREARRRRRSSAHSGWRCAIRRAGAQADARDARRETRRSGRSRIGDRPLSRKRAPFRRP